MEKNEIERINWELLKTNLDILQSLSDSLFDIEYKRLEDLSELYSRIESERLADIEDREKKGALAADGEVMTKEKAEEEKLKIQSYYDSVQRDIEKQEEERKRQQFLIDQAFAVGNVMMGMAQMIMNPLNVGGALTPLYVGLAAAQVGVIMAQSIPYFKDGGIMDSTGYAVLGDGGKREPYISPNGEIGISPSTPTLMKLEKGTKIFPSLDAFERDKTLSLKNIKDESFDFYLILSELRKQNKSNKKVINRGLSTFDAMLLGEKYHKLKKS